MLLSVAVLGSMSIPFFFEALNINNLIYVDGGVTFNYPITFFDSKDPNFKNTIGLAFAQSTDTPEDTTKVDAFGYDHLIEFVKHYFETIQNSQAIIWKEDPRLKNKTILIETNGIKSTNFNLTNEQKIMLYNNGQTAANDFLENYGSFV